MTRRTLSGLALGAVLVLGVGAQAAYSTPPGKNGQITFRRFLDAERTIGAIFTIKPDGTGERQLTRPPAGATDDFPDYAGDGSFVAFQRCGEFCSIWTVKADGTGARRITDSCDLAKERCGDNWYPAIAPNGREIAFTHAFGRIVDDVIDHVGIYAVRPDGSGLRKITLPPKRQAEDGEAQWSPDGRKLVFVRYDLKRERQAIHTVNADGSGLKRVTPWELQAGDGPDWSPDGSKILFRSPENSDFLGSNLYTIRPDGTGLKRITNVPDGTKLYSASFSPDGRQITLGHQGVGGLSDVFRMPATGGPLTPVTQTASHDSAPDWGGTKARR